MGVCCGMRLSMLCSGMLSQPKIDPLGLRVKPFIVWGVAIWQVPLPAWEAAALAAERDLTAEEIALIKGRKWIEMIHYGVSFFMLEKLAAVIGVSNPEVYAAFRGETLDEFRREVRLTAAAWTEDLLEK